MNRKRPLPILVPKASQQKRTREAHFMNLPNGGHNPQNPRFLPQNLPPFDFPSSVQNGLQASSQLIPYQPPGALSPGFPNMDFGNQIQRAPNHDFRNFSHFVPHLQQPGPPQNTQVAPPAPPNFQLLQPGPHNFEQFQQSPFGLFPLSQPPPSQFNFLPLPQLPGDNFRMQLPPSSQNMLQAQLQGPSGNNQIITTPPSQVVPLPPSQSIIQNAQNQAPAPQTPLGHPTQKLMKLGPHELQLIQDVLSQLPPLHQFPAISQIGEKPIDVAPEVEAPRPQLAALPGPLQHRDLPHIQQQDLPFNLPLLAQPKPCLVPQLPTQKVPSSILDVQNVPTSELQETLQEQPPKLQPVTQHGARSLQYPEMPTLYPEVLAQDQLPQDKLPPSQPPKLVSQLQDHAVPDFQNMHSSEPQVIQNPLGQTAQLQKVSSSQEVSRTDPNELQGIQNSQNPVPCSLSIPEEVPHSDMVCQKVLKILQQASHEMLKPMPEPQPDPAQLEISKYSAILKHLFGSKSLDKFHRDPSSLPHHFQFQLLTVPPHVPAPQTLEHLEEIVKFNRDQITKKSLKENQMQWILEKLEQYGGVHKKKIDLFKTCEFREDFLVKLYYKYHQILIGSSSTNTVAYDDMEPFKKWMCTNAHCHREMMEIGEKHEEADEDIRKQVMKELRKAVKRSTKRLDPTFWKGLQEIQDVMLKAIGKPEIAAIVRKEIKREIRLLERAQHEPGPVVFASDVEDYDDVGNRRENEETSRAEHEVAPHSSMAPHSEKRKEKDGLVDGQEGDEVADLDELASTAKPQVLEDVSPESSEDQLGPEVPDPSPPQTSQEPEAAINPLVCCIPSTSNLPASPQTTQNSETCDLPASTSKIYNVPIDLTMNPSQLEIVFALVKELSEKTRLKESKVIHLQNEKLGLKIILDGLKENSEKSSRLTIQKSKTVNRIEEQESNLRRIIMRKKEVHDSITILEEQKEEHRHFLKEAEEEVEISKQNYEEKVKETEEYHQNVFVVEHSGSILADVWKAIDLMESSRFASLCAQVKERRNLMEDLQMKMNVVVDGKKEIEKIEERTKLAEEKLKGTELKVKEESEKLEADKEKLREITAEIETMEKEKKRLGGLKMESENLIEEVTRELELIEKTCKRLELQIHCSEKSKQTKSAMTSPTYALDYIPDSSTQDAPAFLGLRDNTLGYNGLPSSSNLTSVRKSKNTHEDLGQGSSSTPQHQSYLRRLISREFSNSRPRIILKISREKYLEAERIRREQEREMGKEQEEEEIERGVNDDGTDGGGEEERQQPQQTLEAHIDKNEGRPKKYKTKRRSLDGNVCDGEGASPPKQRK